MNTNSITSQEITNALADTVSIKPNWLRVKQATAYSGLCRSKLYELIGNGSIKSISLRDRGAIRGTRLISVASIDQFLNEAAEDEKTA